MERRGDGKNISFPPETEKNLVVQMSMLPWIHEDS